MFRYAYLLSQYSINWVQYFKCSGVIIHVYLQQCNDELNSIYGDEDPSRTSVYRWYSEFNRGRSSLQNEFRTGRQKSVVVPETIDAVRQLILQDRHVVYREIETNLGISGISIHSILLEHLIANKFIPVGSHTICQSLSHIGSNYFIFEHSKHRFDELSLGIHALECVFRTLTTQSPQ